MYKDLRIPAFNMFNDYKSPYTFKVWHPKLECLSTELVSPTRTMLSRLKSVILPGSLNLYLLSEAVIYILPRHCYVYLTILACVARSWAILPRTWGTNSHRKSSLLPPVLWTEKKLKGRHFSSDAEVIAAAEKWLDGQPSDFF